MISFDIWTDLQWMETKTFYWLMSMRYWYHLSVKSRVESRAVRKWIFTVFVHKMKVNGVQTNIGYWTFKKDISFVLHRRMSHRFGMTWVWITDDIILILVELSLFRCIRADCLHECVGFECNVTPAAESGSFCILHQ